MSVVAICQKDLNQNLKNATQRSAAAPWARTRATQVQFPNRDPFPIANPAASPALVRNYRPTQVHHGPESYTSTCITKGAHSVTQN